MDVSLSAITSRLDTELTSVNPMNYRRAATDKVVSTLSEYVEKGAIPQVLTVAKTFSARLTRDRCVSADEIEQKVQSVCFEHFQSALKRQGKESSTYLSNLENWFNMLAKMPIELRSPYLLFLIENIKEVYQNDEMPFDLIEFQKAHLISSLKNLAGEDDAVIEEINNLGKFFEAMQAQKSLLQASNISLSEALLQLQKIDEQDFKDRDLIQKISDQASKIVQTVNVSDEESLIQLTLFQSLLNKVRKDVGLGELEETEFEMDTTGDADLARRLQEEEEEEYLS